ncbi:MAG: hypothetical protein QM758_05715 [Armatimonas sp.]
MNSVRLTPRQEDEWRSSIPLLDYMDFYALSSEGLQESNSRLATRAVPKWATELRGDLINQGWLKKQEDQGAWVPEFALRSEVALTGIAITYPYYTEAEQVYERLFIRFVTEALRPFVVHAAQSVRYRRRGYQPLVKLYHLCERYSTMDGALLWPKYLESYPKRVWDNIEARLHRWRPHSWTPEEREIGWASHTSQSLLGAITSLNTDAPLPLLFEWDIRSLIQDLETLHTWTIEGTGGIERRHTDLVAAAYLVALQSECPPPNWLPQT